MLPAGNVTMRPGPFSFDTSPYLREAVDDFANPEVEVGVYVSGPQSGKTTMEVCQLAYAAAIDPGPSLVVMAELESAKNFMEERFYPIINANDWWERQLPEDIRKRTLDGCQFDRMRLSLVGSNSPSRLASRPVRYLWLDEVDKYPGRTKKEASAIDLAIHRTATFDTNRKINLMSTPTVADGDNIWRWFLKGDQRLFVMPCIRCGHGFDFRFEYLVFDHCRHDGEWDLQEVESKTFVRCPHCKGEIADYEKSAMMRRGAWQPTAKGEPRIRSRKLNGLYPEWIRWGEIARDWCESHKDVGSLHNFVNGRLAEPFEERFDASTEKDILAREQDYPARTCPVRPEVIIISVDVQDDKKGFFYTVRAWCKNNTSYLLRYGQALEFSELTAIADEHYICGSDPCLVNVRLIDSGYRTDEVYQFCLDTGNWIPTKGRGDSQIKLPVIWSENAPGGLRLMLFNADYFKESLHWRIQSIHTGDPGAWYVHKGTEMSYAKQITSEARTCERDKYGKTVRKWKKGRERNEMLDCEVMSLAYWSQLAVTPRSKPSSMPRLRPTIRL